MIRKALSDKVLVLGIDGMDPRISLRHMEQGYMPNLKKLLERGSAREDLVLLGAMPTITPPMWTTLATGAYPMTHGITDFWRQDPEHLDILNYNLDSRLCKAEQLWNITAEAGKKHLLCTGPAPVGLQQVTMKIFLLLMEQIQRGFVWQQVKWAKNTLPSVAKKLPILPINQKQDPRKCCVS